MTTLKERLIKIGAKGVSHGRYVAFQMAEVAISRQLLARQTVQGQHGQWGEEGAEKEASRNSPGRESTMDTYTLMIWLIQSLFAAMAISNRIAKKRFLKRISTPPAWVKQR